MIKNFTLDDVIRYSYDEMETTERLSFEEELSMNAELRSCFESIVESKKDLEAAALSPRQVIVDQVLDYSKLTAPLEHTL